MDKKFIDAVNNSNIVRVRFSLSNELLLDPRGYTFIEMKTFAESHLDGLYEKDDSKVYTDDIKNWDDKYLKEVKNDLDLNFSKEKLEYYEKVAKVVLKEKAINLDGEERKTCKNKNADSFTYSSSSRTSFSEMDTNKKIHQGITIGGAVIAVAGLFIEKTAVACAVSSLGLIGVAVGGYLLYNDSKK